MLRGGLAVQSVFVFSDKLTKSNFYTDKPEFSRHTVLLYLPGENTVVQ